MFAPPVAAFWPNPASFPASYEYHRTDTKVTMRDPRYPCRTHSNRLRSCCLSSGRAIVTRSSGCSRDACRRCAAGRADGFLRPRAARSIPRISSRTRSSTRYGGSIISTRGMKERCRPTCARPCSTGFATRRDDSAAARRRRADGFVPVGRRLSARHRDRTRGRGPLRSRAAATASSRSRSDHRPPRASARLSGTCSDSRKAECECRARRRHARARPIDGATQCSLSAITSRCSSRLLTAPRSTGPRSTPPPRRAPSARAIEICGSSRASRSCIARSFSTKRSIARRTVDEAAPAADPADVGPSHDRVAHRVGSVRANLSRPRSAVQSRRRAEASARRHHAVPSRRAPPRRGAHARASPIIPMS